MHQLTGKLNSYFHSIALNDLDYVPTALHTLDADDKLASSSSFLFALQRPTKESVVECNYKTHSLSS